MIIHDSWPRIKEIFHSALELTAVERKDFLDKACGDDPSIREEVEALLQADAGNDQFLSAPAYEFAAGMLAGEDSEFSAGQKVGRYTILHTLGSGGMGQIYLAQDPQLGRKIALKVISPAFASDARRVQRFEQEARASSALNHPNICVVHEIGMTDAGRHFIAMEYIQGSTVRDRLARGGFSLLETVNIALQVAAALASAHAGGIVHRDIKPENIMVRPDGYVKVLDFGLAKLLPEHQGWRRASGSVLTETGTLMGTVKYMSPEQLRESAIDQRSDIWSLGVVLYEMLTGSTPFEARTSNEAVAQILSPQRTPLKFPDEVPRWLQDIVTVALEKDCGARYQTITRLAHDLKKVQRQLHRAAEESELIHATDLKTRELSTGTALFTRIKSQALSTADFLITEIRSHKTAIFAGATSVLVLLLFLPSFFPPAKPVTYSMQSMTNAGTTVSSAISSDGKLIAHAEDQAGMQKVVVTSTSTFASEMVVPPASVRYLGIAFSPANNYLYLTRAEGADTVLYRLALFGGVPVEIKRNVDSPITFSPQGDRFAFVRHHAQTSEDSLVISNTEGTDERVIGTRKDGEILSSGPAWSPDGARIVCPAGFWRGDFYMHLVGFDVDSGRQTPIGGESWFAISHVAWQRDMSALVISARDRATSTNQLWRVAYPGGAVQRITNDLADYRGVSLWGDNIVTIQITRSWQMWVAKADNSAPPAPIASGVGFSYGVTWTPREKIVFSSRAQERLNLVYVDPDGSKQVQLTLDKGDNYNPAASPDGNFVVFSSNREGTFEIWRVNSHDGSDPKRLTDHNGNFYPAVSPDSQWVAYDRIIDGKASIWKVRVGGGDAVKLIDRYRMPAFSPDNRFLVGRFDLVSGTSDVAIFPAEGGEPVQKIEKTIPVIDWQRVVWIGTRKLSYINNVDGNSNIWSYDLDSQKSRQLTYFSGQQVFAYAWSPDFKEVACQCGNSISNVTMLTPDTPQR
jgi:serine/threonine protein kinase/WD40 repeat protein